ncbi:unnamed protein product [Owenia fusiformis]|uniref:Uncharacterized protein n=1 Tax=Owenia fusiformis TaxID=6347 RepID=A0A8J1THI2_OWEFU|nr:unnamed protein product [Owenia fusiformis]
MIDAHVFAISDEYKVYKSSDLERNMAINKCSLECGGVLAKIDNAVDSAILKDVFDSNSMGLRSVWIGAKRTSGSSWGEWYNDGSPLTWTNWETPPDSKDYVYVKAGSMAWNTAGSTFETGGVACMIVHEITTAVPSTAATTTAERLCKAQQFGTMTYSLKIENKAVNNLANVIGGEFTTRSKLECATKCFGVANSTCRAFLFNKSDKKCALLESTIPLSNFVVGIDDVSYYEVD